MWGDVSQTHYTNMTIGNNTCCTECGTWSKSHASYSLKEQHIIYLLTLPFFSEQVSTELHLQGAGVNLVLTGWVAERQMDSQNNTILKEAEIQIP